jgi:hypothetical protein
MFISNSLHLALGASGGQTKRPPGKPVAALFPFHKHAKGCVAAISEPTTSHL